MPKFIIDTETRCDLKIAEVGVTRYTRDPSFEMIIAIGHDPADPAAVFEWQLGDPNPEWLINRMADPAVEFVTVNAPFDLEVLEVEAQRRGWPVVPIERWIDIASRSAAMNFPRSLDQMVPTLGLPVEAQKDTRRGKALIRLFCMPAKPTKKRPQGGFVAPQERPEDWEAFVAYARQDVVAAAACDAVLPPLTAPERIIELATWRMNRRGVPIDLPLVESANRLVAEHSGKLEARFVEITGCKPRAAVKVREWLNSCGIDVTGTDRTALQDVMKRTDLPADVREAVAIRQDIGAAAVLKFATMMARHVNGRLHDEFLYLGASMTGRWSSRGVQLQNALRPRLSGAQIQLFIQLLHEGRIDLARKIFERPVDDLASLVRSAIIGPLSLCDFKTIEFRLLLWFANEILPDGDVYRQSAADIFGKPVSLVDKFERQIAKAVVLGGGYQLSAPSFKRQLKEGSNVEITDELAETSIADYRSRFAGVVRLWAQLDHGFVACFMQRKEIPIADGRAAFLPLPDNSLGRCIGLRLPSGRVLRYNGVELHNSPYSALPRAVFQFVKGGKLMLSSLFPGRITEHLVSGMARDLLALSAVKIDRAGLPLEMLIHDEAVIGVDTAEAYAQLEKFMLEVPSWAKGAAITVEGERGDRYAK